MPLSNLVGQWPGARPHPYALDLCAWLESRLSLRKEGRRGEVGWEFGERRVRGERRQLINEAQHVVLTDTKVQTDRHEDKHTHGHTD